VALRVLLDVDGASAAALMGITPSACSTHLHRAMTKLRKELNHD
jgi:DNA-directed RNA polymerase specialized sigma24 family protein